ncbi:MAG: hypothetical protein M1817_003049 [Caeruleum heppii]|nr:MAG: hypothetical protein M1817_003049 [Caeruleum heppii]
MAGLDMSAEGLIDVAFDGREARYGYQARTSWPLPLHHHQQPLPESSQARRASTPLQQTVGHGFHPLDTSTIPLGDWSLQQPSHVSYAQADPSMATAYTDPFGLPFQTSPMDFLPQSQAQYGLSMAPLVPLPTAGDALQWTWEDFQTDVMGFNNAQSLADNGLGQTSFDHASFVATSPTDTYLEVRSLTSSSSDNGWAAIDYQSLDSYRDATAGAIFNPGETLHIRTDSDSSQSDAVPDLRTSFDGFEDIQYPLTSPDSDVHIDLACHFPRPAEVSPSAAVAPLPIKTSTSSRCSTSSQDLSSPPSRRHNRKSPIAKATKPVIRRPSHASKKDNEKRIGRRRGPLLPEQRKQASEIRKLRACLRCKFLKKTCDKGEPCAGCQPAHARLWQVPCTRIDIKDLGYFMKDYRADFERHVSLGFSVTNITGYSADETMLYITHGYGFVLPVSAREVFVRDDDCFAVQWTESDHEKPMDFSEQTSKLSAGYEGISTTILSEYLDKHIEGSFEKWVDDYFEGTPFLTEILKTAHRFYSREKMPVIKKALKLVLAYNLTQHITMVEGLGDEEDLVGKIHDPNSKYRGKTMAPVMINFQVKVALANMWRELQRDILEELSALYSSVYSGEKLKNWPTIFILAAILLAVWEEMQFDCHYRVPDPNAVDKFCSDMETTPVGVIVGLFSAISQKLPAFNEWDSRKHHHLLNSNEAVCEAMTEVRQHISRYESYLKSRSKASFDREDFDCLSNKFLAKLVIRAN